MMLALDDNYTAVLGGWLFVKEVYCIVFQCCRIEEHQWLLELYYVWIFHDVLVRESHFVNDSSMNQHRRDTL